MDFSETITIERAEAGAFIITQTDAQNNPHRHVAVDVGMMIQLVQGWGWTTRASVAQTDRA
jgi:hypothetical protein